MIITAICYACEDESVIKVTTSDEGEVFVPWPCCTWHMEIIQAWLDDGGTITAYVAPVVADWEGFRHWLNTSDEGQAVMNHIITGSATDPRVATVNAYLMDQLRTGDYNGVVQFANQIDGYISFTSQEKSDVNNAASTYHLPGPIFS